MKWGVPLASLKMGSLCCLKRFPFLLSSHGGGQCLCVSAILTISKQLPGSRWLLYFTLYLVFMVDKDTRKCLSEKWLSEEKSRYSATGRAKALVSPALVSWGWRQFLVLCMNPLGMWVLTHMYFRLCGTYPLQGYIKLNKADMTV